MPTTDLVKLRAEFDRCWSWLDKALEYGAFVHEGMVWKTHTKEDIWRGIIQAWWFFWPNTKSAAITRIFTMPTGLRTHQSWLTGGVENESEDEIVAMTREIEDWGRRRGCHRQVGYGRRGWLKVLDGYREIGTHREKNLVE